MANRKHNNTRIHDQIIFSGIFALMLGLVIGGFGALLIVRILI